MITPDDIEISHRYHGSFGREICAKFQTYAVIRIAPHECRSRKLPKLAELLLRRKIWRKVYGELSDALSELEGIQLYSVHPADESRLRELVAKTRALMAFPE
jgi:hypothetical protein